MVIETVVSLLIGYLLGMLSPAALFAKRKKVNLRKCGTGNLGATNTTMVLGKKYGALVMILDIGKAFLACKLAELLFPELAVADLLAGAASVVGHIFPFYMKFKGGKGLAAFGGMILAYNPWILLGLLAVGIVLIFIFNYGIAITIFAAVTDGYSKCHERSVGWTELSDFFRKVPEAKTEILWGHSMAEASSVR